MVVASAANPREGAATPSPSIGTLRDVERSEWPDDEPEEFSPCSPPHERAWRHPSELGLVAAGAAGTVLVAHRRVPRGRLAFALVAASTSALALYGLATLAFHSTGRSRGVGEAARSALFPSASSESSLLSSGPLSTFTGSSVTSDGMVSLVAIIGAVEQRVSAVAVDDKGTLVTGTDAVSGATRLESVDGDGHRWAVTVLGTDATTGLTVLASSHPSASASVGTCAGVAPGDLVQLGDRVGAVTARVAEVGLRADHGGSVVYPLIRLEPNGPFTVRGGDAVIDTSGRVVAVAIGRQGRDVLAAPADVAVGLATGLRQNGTASRPWLGVSGGDDNGAVVHMVTAGSPAAAAGLADGDVIERVDGHAVGTMWHVVLMMQRHVVGDTVTMGVRRGQDLHTMSITLIERPSTSAAPAAPTR